MARLNPDSAAPPEPSLRSGFVCVAGRPNVGKSTLVNRLVGRPVTITSAKPQTTRQRVLGVCHGPGFQAVLVDTPGIHQPRDPLNVRLVRYAQAALADADAVLLVVEPLPATAPGAAPPPLAPADRLVLERLKGLKTPRLLAVNKIDQTSPQQLLHTLRAYGDLGLFQELVPISALKGEGVPRLLELLVARLPPGPPYFDPGQVTDQSPAAWVAELVRQEVFRRTEQEVPYGTAVQVESVQPKGRKTAIHARIVVERDSQKGILIGKGGRMLKDIGSAARRKAELIIGGPVYLALHVVVLADWSRNPRHLAELGYPEE